MSFYKTGSDTTKDYLYIQVFTSDEETARYSLPSASGKTVDAVSYIFKGLSEDASKETASVRKNVATELTKQEFSVPSDPVC